MAFRAIITTELATTILSADSEGGKTFENRDDAVELLREFWPVARDNALVIGVVDDDGELETLWRRPTPLTELPTGYYALEGKRYTVSRKDSGKWADWTFVATGSDYHERKTFAMIKPTGEIVKASDHGRKVVAAFAADPKARMCEYGHITGTCGRCGRKLEDPVSRAMGIGPICAGKI